MGKKDLNTHSLVWYKKIGFSLSFYPLSLNRKELRPRTCRCIIQISSPPPLNIQPWVVFLITNLNKRVWKQLRKKIRHIEYKNGKQNIIHHIKHCIILVCAVIITELARISSNMIQNWIKVHKVNFVKLCFSFKEWNIKYYEPLLKTRYDVLYILTFFLTAHCVHK